MRALAPALLVTAALSAAAARADCPGADRLQETLTLVAAANPVLAAERGEFEEQSRQPRWEASLSIGYSVTDTRESGAAGPNAALRVEIPLFDRAHELKVAAARTAWRRAEDGLLTGFLGDLEKLCADAAALRERATLRAFYRDRLAYRQKRVDEGLEETPVLWSESETVQKAEHAWREAAETLAARRLTLARRYGGEEWSKLRALLAAMTR